MAVSQRFRRIEAIAQKHITDGSFGGIEWLVLRGGKPWARGRAGYNDALDKTPMVEKPIYRIYSMTKPVISAIALMLVEQGRLRLFEPLAAYLPEFSEMSVLDEDGNLRKADGPIIIEHLLTHRAGLSYGFIPGCPVGKLYCDTNINDATMPLAGVIETVAALPLAFEPGSEWRYSVATDVLARVIEVICGDSIANVVREFITDPLEMVDTGYSVAASQQDRIVAAFGKDDLNALMDFDDQPQSLIPAELSAQHPLDDQNFGRGGYGLYSTLDDYAGFAMLLATGKAPSGERLLSRKMLELAVSNRIPPGQLPLRIGPLVLPGYGYGLAGRVMLDLGQSLGMTSVGEHGWAGAASTYFWIDPSEDLIGLSMSQYLGSKIPLGDDIRSAVYQALDE